MLGSHPFSFHLFGPPFGISLTSVATFSVIGCSDLGCSFGDSGCFCCCFCCACCFSCFFACFLMSRAFLSSCFLAIVSQSCTGSSARAASLRIFLYASGLSSFAREKLNVFPTGSVFSDIILSSLFKATLLIARSSSKFSILANKVRAADIFFISFFSTPSSNVLYPRSASFLVELSFAIEMTLEYISLMNFLNSPGLAPTAISMSSVTSPLEYGLIGFTFSPPMPVFNIYRASLTLGFPAFGYLVSALSRFCRPLSPKNSFTNSYVYFGILFMFLSSPIPTASTSPGMPPAASIEAAPTPGMLDVPRSTNGFPDSIPRIMSAAFPAMVSSPLFSFGSLKALYSQLSGP